MSDTKPKITIYTDGGCQPNPGPGGWGALLIYPDDERELSGGDLKTTNNQMELTAAITALESLEEPATITLYTDSTYVRNGITEWLAGWARRGWVTSKGDPVKNVELWQRLHAATQRHDINWRWVRGHAGNVHNERVDRLATAARQEITGEPVAPKKATTQPAGLPTEANSDLHIFINGQYDYKTKRGAWAAVVVDHGEAYEMSGTAEDTENRAQLLAAIYALESLDKTRVADVFTASEYVQKGISQWVQGWMKKGWKTAKGQPVKNSDLWKRLLAQTQKHLVTWHYAPASHDLINRAATTASRVMQNTE